MNLPPTPVLSPGVGPLHARRCVRHTAREAAARCPGCADFFCRECVVEHQGRLLCSSCLARSAIGTGHAGQRRAAVRRASAVLAAAALLWVLFYGAAVLLLKIPPDFHDGTLWSRVGGKDGP